MTCPWGSPPPSFRNSHSSLSDLPSMYSGTHSCLLLFQMCQGYPGSLAVKWVKNQALWGPWSRGLGKGDRLCIFKNLPWQFCWALSDLVYFSFPSLREVSSLWNLLSLGSNCNPEKIGVESDRLPDVCLGTNTGTHLLSGGKPLFACSGELTNCESWAWWWWSDRNSISPPCVEGWKEATIY